MAIISNLYKDNLCTEPIKSIQPGQAGIVGYWANPSHWNSVPTGLTEDDKQLYIYKAFINKDKDGNSIRAGSDFGIVADGGGILYNLQTTESSFSVLDEVIKADTQTQGGSTFNNALFAGVMTYDDDAKKACYIRFSNGIYARSVYTEIGSYTQDPWEGTRQTWDYYNYTGFSSNKFCMTGTTEIGANSRFGFAKVYSLSFDGLDCYAFFIGIDFDGSINDTGNYITDIYVIPKALFKDKVPKPYVGPVTPESAAGFDPPGRDLYNDSISIRNIENNNPFSFNSGGVNLILQSAEQYKYFVNGIYHGGALVSGLGTVGGTSGFAQRPQEQVEIMNKGVLSCKMMPSFELTGTGQCNDDSICGYQIGLQSMWSSLNGVGLYVNQIAKVNIQCGYIGRTYNNFLDFEPYTSMTLHIPFLGDVAIDPSVLYGAQLYLQGYVDYFTGLLSLSVVIEKNGVSYVYTTLQGTCAVDVPIIGAGSSSTQAIGKIASGLGKLTANPVNGVFGVLQGLSQVGKSVPITQNAQSSLAAMFSPRSIYLTINTPLPENPENYAALMGTVVRKEGTVGKYTGYSEFSAVNLSTVNATDAEKQEIERLLKGGVFV